MGEGDSPRGDDVEERRYPHRLLAVIPVLALSMQFQDQILGLIFAFVMSFITSRMFPWIEYTKKEGKSE